MTSQAITFDFHDTIAACPEWFELEVRRLPSAFLRWQSANVDPDLLADADARYRQLRREIMAHGEELPAEACLARVFTAMGRDVPGDELATGVEELMRAALPTATPVPGALEAIQTIDAAGIPIGVVSSAVYHPFLEWTLNAFGIRSAFRVVVTSASAGYYKSRPEIYWHAAERLDVRPQRMVHVGDSLRFDVGGAARAGLGTVWLRHGRAERGDEDVRPDLTIDTLEAASPEILAVLSGRATRNGRSDAP
jgi:HAD superfamily hydrolase (TIGR01509 family)